MVFDDKLGVHACGSPMQASVHVQVLIESTMIQQLRTETAPRLAVTVSSIMIIMCHYYCILRLQDNVRLVMCWHACIYINISKPLFGTIFRISFLNLCVKSKVSYGIIVLINGDCSRDWQMLFTKSIEVAKLHCVRHRQVDFCKYNNYSKLWKFW